MRAIFNNLGRVNDSNPVAHPLVKDYLKFIREEQAGLAITPSQAVPLFFGKFQQLFAHLRDLCSSSVSLSSAGKYILVRDATFFIVDFFTGDRASDLGRLQSCNVFRLRDREGFLLRFTLTKNLRKAFPHSFRVGLSNSLGLLGCSSEDVAHFLGWKSGEVAKRYMQGSDATVSLTLLEKGFPRAASGTVTPVSHPDNLQAAV